MSLHNKENIKMLKYIFNLNLMNKIVIMCMIFIASTFLSADSLQIMKTDGSTSLITIEDIDNITFSDGAGGYTAPEMISVPAGSFEMGQLDIGGGTSEPIHNVTLTNDYSMSKYEITNQNFSDMLNYALIFNELSGNYANNITVNNANGESFQLLDLDGISTNGQFFCEISFNGSQFVPDAGRENRPVILVTWHGAAFYTNMLSRNDGLTELYDLSDWSCNIYPATDSGYRLPTEAEWEYAARYDDGRIYPWGDEFPTGNHANYDFDYNGGVDDKTDVGSYSPLGDSQLGFCDMAGNVWEMTNDWVGDYTEEDQVDPTGPESNYNNHRIRRGGDFANWDLSLPCAFRSNYHIQLPLIGTGFRIAKIGE